MVEQYYCYIAWVYHTVEVVWISGLQRLYYPSIPGVHHLRATIISEH